MAQAGTITIEHVEPEVDCGKYEAHAPHLCGEYNTPNDGVLQTFCRGSVTYNCGFQVVELFYEPSSNSYLAQWPAIYRAIVVTLRPFNPYTMISDSDSEETDPAAAAAAIERVNNGYPQDSDSGEETRW